MPSQARHRILITDIAWGSLDVEREVLPDTAFELVLAETGTDDELVRLAGDATAILTNWRPVSPRVLAAAPRCLTVARYGVGTDNIAVDAATELGIVVTAVPDYCVDEVSEHALALLLASARRVVTFASATAAGTWDLRGAGPLPRLRGQVVGLVGFGRIARALAAKASGIGMAVQAYDPHVPAEDIPPEVRRVDSLASLLSSSDYVSLHVPATEQTHHLIGAAEFAQMKESAYLINTARGALVDEAALDAALANQAIAGAALDVLEVEPPTDSRLASRPNVIVTPHSAFSSVVSVLDLRRRAAGNAAAVLAGGQPEFVANEEVFEMSAYKARNSKEAQ